MIPPSAAQTMEYCAWPGSSSAGSLTSASPGERQRAVATEPDLPHVGQVEQPDRGPDRPVLLELRRVPDRHFVAGEGDEPGAQRAVGRVERAVPRRRGERHRTRSGVACAAVAGVAEGTAAPSEAPSVAPASSPSACSTTLRSVG